MIIIKAVIRFLYHFPDRSDCMISLDEDRCQGCGLCVEACPKKILTIDKTKVNKRGHAPAVVIEPKKCISCALCAVMCPDVAIEVNQNLQAG